MRIKLGIILALVVVSIQLKAQVVDKISCLSPKVLDLSSNSDVDGKVKKIYFDDHDDHTFWYKIPIRENGNLDYDFEPFDEIGNYDLFLYEYYGSNFCRSMVQNNLDLLSFEPKVSFKVKKDQVYYLGILPRSHRNCGYHLRFTFEGVSQTYKVINSGKNCDPPSDDMASNNREEEPVPESGYVANSLLTVKGKVYNAKTRQTIPASLWLEEPFMKHKVTATADGTFGFSVPLEREGDYKVHIHAFGFESQVVILSVYDDEAYNYYLEPVEGDKFVLRQIYFYPNTYALKPDSEPELDHLHAFMRANPGAQIEVVGHTNGDRDVKRSKLSQQSGEEWNFNGTSKELSRRRAEKIRAYLVDRGIDKERVKAIGKGGSEMVVKSPTSMKEAMQNIRVEVNLISR